MKTVVLDYFAVNRKDRYKEVPIVKEHYDQKI